MYEPIPLSPSSIRDLTCMFKFRELRLLGRWPNSSMSNNAMNGRAAHAVFADLFDPRNGSCPPHRDRIDTAVARAVAAERYPDDQSRKVACEWIKGLIPTYLASHDPTQTILAVEQADEFPLYYRGRNVAQVAARLDRIEIDEDHPETLVVIDLAFGGKSLTIHQTWMQLAVAKHLFHNRGYTQHRLEIHSIGGEHVDVVAWRGCNLKGVHLEIAELAAAFQEANAKGTIKATQGEACMYCPLKPRCPAQVPVDVESLGFDTEDC